MKPEPLWKIALARGLAALDWHTGGSDVMPILARPGASLAADTHARMARAAAVEIDKLVAQHQASDGPELAAANAVRRRMADLMQHERGEYDAILEAKAAYRAALLDAAWRLVEADPAHKLLGWAAPHED